MNPVTHPTAPAPAVVVPASPVIPKAAPVPPPTVKSPASPKQDDAKPLPSVKPEVISGVKSSPVRTCHKPPPGWPAIYSDQCDYKTK